MFHIPEEFRITKESSLKDVFDFTHLISDKTLTESGAFRVPKLGSKTGKYYLCIASNGEGWEHVSVTIPSEKRSPTWEEMTYIKSIFWEAEDVVVQFHPAKADYINNHKYCLHLWKRAGGQFETPKSYLVGVK